MSFVNYFLPIYGLTSYSLVFLFVIKKIFFLILAVLYFHCST